MLDISDKKTSGKINTNKDKDNTTKNKSANDNTAADTLLVGIH